MEREELLRVTAKRYAEARRAANDAERAASGRRDPLSRVRLLGQPEQLRLQPAEHLCEIRLGSLRHEPA